MDADPTYLRYMPSGRLMQCKDIPDDAFINAVRQTPGLDERPDSWRMRWDVRTTLETTLGPLPEKLFLAKAGRLMARSILGGCPCGCRGDYHLVEDCEFSENCCQ